MPRHGLRAFRDNRQPCNESTLLPPPRHPAGSPCTRPANDPESVEHLTAKTLLAAWLTAQAQDHLVELYLDNHQLTSPDGHTVKPDVYAVLSTGAKVAIEYQFSPGASDVLLAKHHAYQQMCITDWWVYGPGAPTCPVLEHTDTAITVTSTNCQRELAQVGGDYFWFDPFNARLATPMVVGRARIWPQPNEAWGTDRPSTAKSYVRKPFWNGWRTVRLDDSLLADCALDVRTGHLLTPCTRRIGHDAPLLEADKRRMRALAAGRYLQAQTVAAKKVAVDRAAAAAALEAASHPHPVEVDLHIGTTTTSQAKAEGRQLSAAVAAHPPSADADDLGVGAHDVPPTTGLASSSTSTVPLPSASTPPCRSGFWDRLLSRFR